MDSRVLSTAIKNAAHAAGRDETAPAVVSSVALTVMPGAVRLWATDRFRAAWRTVHASDTSSRIDNHDLASSMRSVFIPFRLAQRIGRILAAAKTTVRIDRVPDGLIFNAGDLTVTVRAQADEDDFFDTTVAPLVSETSRWSVAVDRGEPLTRLLRATETGKNARATVDFSGGLLTVRAGDHARTEQPVGTLTADIERAGNSRNDEMWFVVNPTFLRQAVGAAGARAVRLASDGINRPILITADGGDRKAGGEVIMPVRRPVPSRD